MRRLLGAQLELILGTTKTLIKVLFIFWYHFPEYFFVFSRK